MFNNHEDHNSLLDLELSPRDEQRQHILCNELTNRPTNHSSYVEDNDFQQQEQIRTPGRNSHFVWITSTLAALGGVLFGYDSGVVSGALLQLRKEFSLSCNQQEMIVAFLLVGALLAAASGGFLIDHVGRRLSIIINSIIFIFGSILLAASINFPMLLIGRIILGFAVGLSAVAECVYISETSPPSKRGSLVSLNEFGIALGFLMAYLANFIFVDISNGWRIMFSLPCILAILQCIGMCFVPQSPRFLLLKGKSGKAFSVLEKLHGSSEAAEYFEILTSDIKEEKAYSVRDLCSTDGNMRHRLLIALGLVLLQQFSGQPNMLYYAPIIFQLVGFHSDPLSTAATLGLGIIKVISVSITLLCIDRFGRRVFLMLGCTMMTCSMATIATVTLINDQSFPLGEQCSQNLTANESIGNSNANLSLTMMDDSNTSASLEWVTCISLMMFVAGYSVGFGPGVWLLLSEIFPSAIRGRAISVATIANWSANLIVSFSFLDFINFVGVGGSFTIYFIICAFSILFVYFLIPETKGRTLENINNELSNKSTSQWVADRCPTCCNDNRYSEFQHER